MTILVRLACLAATGLLLAACDGGGSNDSTTPPPVTPPKSALIQDQFGATMSAVFGANLITGKPTDVPPTDLPPVSFTTDPIDF